MRLISLALCSVLLSSPALAQQDPAGKFDYYVLALSWAPNWCALTGDSQGDAECDKHGLTFTLHGLWPQFDAGGFPANCRTSARDPSRYDTAAMEDIMGSDGLAWHEWKAHGRCSGLASDDYLALMRKAYDSVQVPPLFSRIGENLQVKPDVIKAAFLESNPALAPEDIAVTCEQGMIQEVRICLTKDLTPRPCGPEFRVCHLPSAELGAVR